MRLLVVRHGETGWNAERRLQGHSDIDLNETGILQANQVAQGLKNTEINIAVSSDLKRAKDTATIICQEQENESLNLFTDERLREFHFGIHEGQPINPEIIARIKSPDDHLDTSMETFNQVKQRVTHFLSWLHSHAHTQATALVATHGGVLRVLLNISNIQWEKSITNCAVLEFTICNAGILTFCSELNFLDR
ncbi:MAG: histidine phosphatase family protein [Oligoflexales bacterium]